MQDKPRGLARLEERIKELLSLLIQEKMKDPRKGLITINDVELSRDRAHAWVYYTVLGDEEDRRRAQELLEQARGFLRTELSRRLAVRRVPQLHFEYDETLDYGERIDRLLEKVRQIEGWEETPPPTEEGEEA